MQSGPITVNSHINTNNPQQAQQGFQTAATGGTLGSGLQGIGLNYVPGSAVRRPLLAPLDIICAAPFSAAAPLRALL